MCSPYNSLTTATSTEINTLGKLSISTSGRHGQTDLIRLMILTTIVTIVQDAVIDGIEDNSHVTQLIVSLVQYL